MRCEYFSLYVTRHINLLEVFAQRYVSFLLSFVLYPLASIAHYLLPIATPSHIVFSVPNTTLPLLYLLGYVLLHLHVKHPLFAE